MNDSSSSENVLLIEDEGDLDFLNSEELMDAEAVCMEKIPASKLNNSTVVSTTASLSAKPTPIVFGEPNRLCSRDVGHISRESVGNSFKFGQSSSLSKSVRTTIYTSASLKSSSSSNMDNCKNEDFNFDANSEPDDCMKMMPGSKLNMSNSTSSTESITNKPTPIVFGKTNQTPISVGKTSTGKVRGGFKFGKPTTSMSKLAGTCTLPSNWEGDDGIFTVSSGLFSTRRSGNNVNLASDLNTTNNSLPAGAPPSMGRNFQFNLDPRQRQYNNNQNQNTVAFHSNNNTGFGLLHMEKMRQRQMDKMNAEEENMRKIDTMIALKKLEEIKSIQELRAAERPRNLIGEQEQIRLEKLEIERRWKELKLERRSFEDQRKIQELQRGVSELQQAVKIEEGSNRSRNVKERLGQINETREENNNRIGNRVRDNGGNIVGEWAKVESRKMEDRKRRFESGLSSKFLGKYKSEIKKVKGDNYRGLPSDLVLTELTDHGPVPAEEFDDRLMPASSLPSDLILTEFGEEGPVPVDKFK